MNSSNFQVNSNYEELKRLNDNLNKKDERESAKIVEALPKQITWTSTIACNLRCCMCQVDRRIDLRGNNLGLPRELLDKTTKQLFPTLRILNTTRMGEPFHDLNFP